MTASAKPRSNKIPTTRSLENVALFYLSRYAASEFSLRRVLENHLRRASQRNPVFANDDVAQNQLRATIAIIIEKHKKTGTLNDKAYAEMKTASLRRAGRSARSIRQRLGQRGVASHLVEDTLTRDNDNETMEEAEIKAALVLARRRKLGPFRVVEADLDRKRKDLATLARAGFSLGVARKVLDMTVEDTEDDA